MSRIKNTSYNLITKYLSDIILILLKFVNRSIFLKVLSAEYLGLSGLFLNIISMLSLTELGIGSAITFNLYKPIKENDSQKLILWISFFKKVYRTISIIIFTIGFLLVPFLDGIIKGDAPGVNIYIIFILYLLQSVSTYMFSAYKGAVIRAHQKEYILTIISTIIQISSNLIQILVLLIFKSYEVYIITMVIFNLLQNLFVSIKVNKLYPWINNKVEAKLTKQEIKKLYKDVYAIFLFKINGVVIKATDNIVLSKFIGLASVGLYSNYVLVYSTFQTLLSSFFNSMSASLGDLHAEGNIQHEIKIFKRIGFIVFWSSGLAVVGFLININDLITLWLGREYLLEESVVFLMGIEIYMYGIMKTSGTFRTSMGLFQEAKYRPIISIFINLFISITFIESIGISAVILGTIIANLTTFIWLDPYIIYKKVFNVEFSDYLITQFKYLVSIIIAFVTASGIAIFNGATIFGFIANCFISLIITNIVFLIIYRRCEEFEFLKVFMNKYLLKKTKNIFKRSSS